VIRAPGSTAPEGSVIWPRRLPAWACAESIVVALIAKKKRRIMAIFPIVRIGPCGEQEQGKKSISER
jgi:hypothetical protein